MLQKSELYSQHPIMISFRMGRPRGRTISFLGVLIGEQITQEVQGAFLHTSFLVDDASFDPEKFAHS